TEKTWYAVWVDGYELTVTFDGEGRIYSGAGFFVFATNDPEFGFVYEPYSTTFRFCLLNFTGVEEVYNATHYEGYNVYDYYAALREGTTINSKLPNTPYTYLEPAIGLSNDVDTITLGVPQGFKVLVGIMVNAGGFDDYLCFNNQPTPTPSLTHISYDSNAYYFEMPANSLSLACTTKLVDV
ncbi:MAG: hypothetical protein IJA22_01715, partial [Clostridia bacterium]|nr:hypothetical protein [Clostridia bacterium]